ncbi:hypothetical protein ABZY90_19835 [Streptomyces sp. NPDC006422]|uniref:hypothetical protein n=1 Tax=unclassified Streptomyces TaxID=2593676 RepID=UPI0033BF58D4
MKPRGKWSLAVLAGTACTAGFGITAAGVEADRPAMVLAGSCFALIGLTAFLLTILHRWITDTARDRERHFEAARALDEERAKYVAARAALEAERERVRRDAAADREHSVARLAEERAVMEDQFESAKAELVCRAFEAGVRMQRSGKLDEPEVPHGRVVRFPTAGPADQQAGERSREHGVVWP